jgi:hypothetical protein
MMRERFLISSIVADSLIDPAARIAELYDKL